MSRNTLNPILALLLLALLPGVAAARADASTVGARWAEADRNGDGVIDRNEAASLPRLAEHFDRVDRNRDARIERSELREAWRVASARRDLRQARGEALRARFRWLDANDDGALTLTELGDHAPRLREHFGVMDTNRDGQLHPEELRAYLKAKWAERRQNIPLS